MELNPLTRNDAQHLANEFKQLEHKHTFQVPDTMDRLMVTDVTIAPFKGPALDEFKYSLQTGFDLNSLLDRYSGTEFTVLVIANIVSVGNITLAQPYFFELRELIEKKVNGFAL